MADGLETEADAGARVAGRLDDHLDRRMGDQRRCIIADMRCAGLGRLVERSRIMGLRRPASSRKLAAGPRHVEIGDADQMHAVGHPHLRQEHGAEFAGADQPDGDGPSRRLPFEQLAMEVHLWAIAALAGPASGLSSVARKPASRHQLWNCACV
jgi:hypothetical protein